MKYPMLSNRARIRRTENKDVYRLFDVEDGENKEIFCDKEHAGFAVRLNGKTDPYAIGNFSRDRVDGMLEDLEKAGLLVHSRVSLKGPGTVYCSLLFPDRRSHRTKNVCFFLSIILYVLWLPVLIAGCLTFYGNFPGPDIKGFFPGFIIGALFATAFHELSHAAATLGAGGTWIEFGVMVNRFVPGAYVLVSDKNVRSRFLRAQCSAAGIECNFLFSGIFLLLCIACRGISGPLLGIAAANLAIAACNLTLTGGLDGIRILGEIMGDVRYPDALIKSVKSSAKRKQLMKKGINGYAQLAAGCITALLKLALPSVYILIAAEVIALWIR